MLKRLKRAFTIMELVVVIAVIAILAAVLIPTFSNVVQNAKVSNDTQTASTLNVALAAYNVEDPITSEDDLRAAVDGTYGEGYYDSLEPESAEYGYHFWYNTETNRIELSRSEDLGPAAEGAQTQKASAKIATSAKTAEFRAEGMRGALKEGYVLLDRSGSTVADTLKQLDTLATADDYMGAITGANNLSDDSYDSSLASNLNAALSATVIITNSGAFRYDNEVRYISFSSSVSTLNGVVFVYDGNAVEQYEIDEQHPTATVTEDITIQLPESVTKVDSYSLYFGNEEKVTITVPSSVKSEEDLAELFYSNSTNATISFGGAKYTINDSQLLKNGEPCGNELDSHPVESFEVAVEGIEQHTDGNYYIALDAIKDGTLNFYTINFVSTDGGIVSDKSVEWKVTPPQQGNSAIISDGVLSNITVGGEYTITATSNSDSTVKAEIKITVVEINGVEVTLENNDGLKENIAFDSENNTYSTTIKTGGEGITYTFGVLPIQSVDGSGVECNGDYTLTITNDTGATISDNVLTLPASGTVEVTLKFDEYAIERHFIFNCVAKIFNYDETAEYYRFGTSNEVQISYADGIDLSDIEITAVPFANQSYNAKATVSSDKKKLTFSGGGKITIKAVSATNEENILDSFVVQIIDGAVNVSTKDQFVTNASMCLVNDITKDNGGITVAQGCTLYGNGYTITASKSSFNSHNSAFLYLSGTLDNVSIIGVEVDDLYFTPDDTEYWKTAATVYVNASGAAIYNSYIANGKYAIRLNGLSGQVTIKNTAAISGAISIGITRTAGQLDVYLENIKVAQMQNTNFMGAGFAFNEGGADKVTIHFSGQNNVLQNFASENNISQFPSSYQTILKEVWDSSDFANFKYSYNNTDYMHLGILAVLESEEEIPQILISEDCNLYGLMTEKVITKLGVSGMLYSFDNTKAGQYVSENIENWLTVAPTKSFTYEALQPTITISNTQLRAEIESSDAQIDCSDLINNNITAIKYGAELEVKVTNVEKINGDGEYLGDLKFSGVGEYKITYTISDRFEIDELGYPVTIERTALLYVDLKAAPPTIEFTKATNINNNGINNPSNIDYTTADYQIEADVHSDYGLEIGDLNAYYVINLVDDLGLKVTTHDGKDITSEATFSVEGTQLNSLSCLEDIEIFSENKPANSEDTSCRYTKKYTITITAEYNGLTTQEDITIVFYVPKISGLKWW